MLYFIGCFGKIIITASLYFVLVRIESASTPPDFLNASHIFKLYSLCWYKPINPLKTSCRGELSILAKPYRFFSQSRGVYWAAKLLPLKIRVRWETFGLSCVVSVICRARPLWRLLPKYFLTKTVSKHLFCPPKNGVKYRKFGLYPHQRRSLVTYCKVFTTTPCFWG